MVEREEITREEALTGYSTKLYRNNKWHEQDGVLCPWEHCIENMPLIDMDFIRARVIDVGNSGIFVDLEVIESIFSCPVFGHLCPGGREQIEVCSQPKRMSEISEMSKLRYNDPEGGTA